MSRIRVGRRRWWLAGAGTALAVTLGVGAAYAGGSPSGVRTDSADTHGTLRTGEVTAACQVTRLPVPDGVEGAVVDAMDPTGRYAVGRPFGVGVSENTLVFWDNWKPTTFQVADTVEAPVPADVNQDGVVVGNASYTWRYANGSVTALAQPSELTRVTAINGAGDVLGERYFGEEESKAVPVFWPADMLDEPRDLIDADPAERITAVDLGDDGTAVLAKSTGEEWPALLVRGGDGELRRLGDPVGDVGAVDIRGDRVMESRRNPDNDYASGPLRLWHLPSGEARELGDEVHGEALTIDGVIAGWTGTEWDGTPGVEPDAHAVLIRGGTRIDLPQPDGAIATVATGIADDGTVVGQAFHTDWRNGYGVIWRGC